MAKLLLRLAVGGLTFGAGVACASFWIARHHRPTQPIQTASVRAVDRPRSMPPKGWQRINVDDKFSFYLPLDMKEAKPIGDSCGPTGDFRNKHLWLNYGYCETTESCNPSPALAGSPSLQTSQIEVGRKKAVLTSWERRPSEKGFMTLCFQDIGDGKTGLSFGAFALDAEGPEVAKKIFDSIEFR